MRRLAFALPVSLLFVLQGCGAEQRTVTDSNAIPEEFIYQRDYRDKSTRGKV